MDDLKRCPYCGKEAIRFRTIQHKVFFESRIVCQDVVFSERDPKCPVRPEVARFRKNAEEAEKAATEAWNTRPDPWSNEPPKEEGWYLIKYMGPNGPWYITKFCKAKDLNGPCFKESAGWQKLTT
jgi:hypothetical protein